MKSLEDIDQTYEGKNKEIMKDLEKDGWAMTPFVDRANYFKEHGYDVENKGGVYMIKPKSNDKLDHEVVNDKSIDAIKDNFSPPGAKSKKKRIRATDNPDWVWDNEDVAKRFMATPYLNGNFSKDMSDKDKAALKEDYKAYKKMSIDDFLKSKDFQPFYEYVGEDEEVEPNNYTSKTLWGEGEQNPYADIDKVLDEWDKDEIDTNDNGKIEVDEMADFQKSLDDYAAKNKKGRDDIPVTTRR